MSKPMKKMLLIVGIVFGLIFAWYAFKQLLISYMISHNVPPPVTVGASVATSKNWQSYLTSVGTLTAVNGVEISSEAAGIVKEIRFNSGQFVKKGDVLVLLDDSIEQAQLKDNKARAVLAKLNFERNQALVLKHAVSQAQLDTLRSAYEEATAGIEQTEAKIRQKTITAPFDGKIGIRLIDLGQFVSAGTAMVSLQSLDPLYVRFDLPENHLNVLYLQQPVEVTVNLGSGKTVRGIITAINSKVDQTTRNILVEATIPNKDFLLYPGMYASVKVLLKEHKNAIVLPQTSISYSLHGDSVYLIKNEGKDRKGQPILKAYRQYVKVGQQRGSEVSILDGVKAGDTVVTAGQLKLQNGSNVAIDNNAEL